MFRNRPVSLALVGLFVWLTGCSSYKQIGIDQLADHDDVRVTLTDGERRELYQAHVEADTLKGRRYSEGTATYAIPLDRVHEVEAKRSNPVGTVIVVGGALVLAGAIAAAAFEASVDDCWPMCLSGGR